MHVAALYDIHGNIDALDAVLEEIGEVDAIVVGGDITWGPFPRQTMDRLASIQVPVLSLRGNADREVAAGQTSAGGWVDEVNTWCAAQLTDEQRASLGALPSTVTLVGEIGEVLFCHATPSSDEELITRETPEEVLVGILEDVKASIVVCGHTHVQFDRQVRGRRVVNAGSVGLPYEDAPGAYWLELDDDKLRLRVTEYDHRAAAARIRTSSGCPHFESFEELILNPGGAAQATAHFESLRMGGEKG